MIHAFTGQSTGKCWKKFSINFQREVQAGGLYFFTLYIHYRVKEPNLLSISTDTIDATSKFRSTEQESTNTPQEDMKSVMLPTEKAEFKAEVSLI